MQGNRIWKHFKKLDALPEAAKKHDAMELAGDVAQEIGRYVLKAVSRQPSGGRKR